MNQKQFKNFHIELMDKIDKERLKELAIALDEELKENALLSKNAVLYKDAAEFAEYPPLVSAIRRAKAGLIDAPEEIANIDYWLFEKEIGDLSDVLSKFRNALRCWRIVEE
jgi:hypothetical protein